MPEDPEPKRFLIFGRKNSPEAPLDDIQLKLAKTKFHKKPLSSLKPKEWDQLGEVVLDAFVGNILEQAKEGGFMRAKWLGNEKSLTVTSNGIGTDGALRLKFKLVLKKG